MDAQSEAMAIWKYLEPMIDQKIQSATRSAVRRKRFTVATAPNGSTVGVTDPGDPTQTVLNIPYDASLANVTVGSTVLCEWTYSMTNLVAKTTGSGV